MSSKLQKKMAVLTDSERHVKKELREMEPDLNKFKKEIKNVFISNNQFL